MKYYGVYNTDITSLTYDTIIGIVRTSEKGEKLLSQRWDKHAHAWVDDPTVIFKVAGYVGDGGYHQISFEQAQILEGPEKTPFDNEGK